MNKTKLYASKITINKNSIVFKSNAGLICAWFTKRERAGKKCKAIIQGGYNSKPIHK